MPRSKRTADTPPVPGAAGCTSGPSAPPIAEKGKWCTRNRESSTASWVPSLIASASISKACIRPRLESAASIPRVCPPRPYVASTTTPSGLGLMSVATTCTAIHSGWLTKGGSGSAGPHRAEVTVGRASATARTSLSSAGVCVPAACRLGRKPVWAALPFEIWRCLPPNAQPFHESASSNAFRSRKVIQPHPLHAPCPSFNSRGTPARRGQAVIRMWLGGR
eukprot:scaffold10462_cov119-Isochrysis_galbana.AAC.7